MKKKRENRKCDIRLKRSRTFRGPRSLNDAALIRNPKGPNSVTLPISSRIHFQLSRVRRGTNEHPDRHE